MSSTDLVAAPIVSPVADMGADEFERLWTVANKLAKSGMFKDAKQAEQAFAKMVIGRELGLGVTQSMIGLHIVDGGVMVHYATLLRFVRAQPGHDYRITEMSNDSVSIEFTIDGESVGVSTFTMEDAKKAGLDKPRGTQPSNYEKYPRNMLLARAVSNGVRFFVPEASAGIPLYVEGEVVEDAVEELTAPTGDGAVPTVEIPESVEPVIARAERVGHAALSDRASIALSLGGQSEGYITGWINGAMKTLDDYEARQKPKPAEDSAPSASEPYPDLEEINERVQQAQVARTPAQSARDQIEGQIGMDEPAVEEPAVEPEPAEEPIVDLGQEDRPSVAEYRARKAYLEKRVQTEQDPGAKELIEDELGFIAAELEELEG